MSATDIQASVSAFLDSYRAAFERGDASAVADHFVYPGYVTSDVGKIVLVPITARQEWLGKVEELLGMYQAIKLSSAHILNLALTEISSRLIQAQVHWALHDAAGLRLYDFVAIYTLANIDGAFRIAAIAHNELPQYQACLARLKAQRA
jgi:hypothetical protein